jgi:pectate lyase
MRDLRRRVPHYRSTQTVRLCRARLEVGAPKPAKRDNNMPTSPIKLIRFIALSLPFLAVAAGCTPPQAATYAGPQPKANPLVNWPKAAGDVPVGQTIKVSGKMDGGMRRFYGVEALDNGTQQEGQDPLFKLADGAILENVILGNPAADGIHCKGSCTLRNVWWENVGEDAATFRGQTEGDTMLIDGGGASGAEDKVFQSNGMGTMHIKDFYVEWFGKLFRSCGNCSKQFGRHVIVENVTAVEGHSTLVGLNVNYGDTVEFRGKNTIYDTSGKFPLCTTFEGNSTGAEPKKLSTAGDSPNCKNMSGVLVKNEIPTDNTNVAIAPDSEE